MAQIAQDLPAAFPESAFMKPVSSIDLTRIGLPTRINASKRSNGKVNSYGNVGEGTRKHPRLREPQCGCVLGFPLDVPVPSCDATLRWGDLRKRADSFETYGRGF